MGRAIQSRPWFLREAMSWWSGTCSSFWVHRKVLGSLVPGKASLPGELLADGADSCIFGRACHGVCLRGVLTVQLSSRPQQLMQNLEIGGILRDNVDCSFGEQLLAVEALQDLEMAASRGSRLSFMGPAEVKRLTDRFLLFVTWQLDTNLNCPFSVCSNTY